MNKITLPIQDIFGAHFLLIRCVHSVCGKSVWVKLYLFSWGKICVGETIFIQFAENLCGRNYIYLVGGNLKYLF